ncbi:MAG: transposase domain-containing protein [Alkalilacustris sp.]
MNPVDYLAAILRAILDGHPKYRIEDLMPWRYAYGTCMRLQEIPAQANPTH